MTLHVGVSTKLYLGPVRTRAWVAEVCAIAARHPATRDGAVEVFVAPTTAVLESSVEIARRSGVRIAAQDVSAYDSGPYTGETGAPFLAELGVEIVEVGHAERRRLFAETDDVVARKASAVQRAGIVPLVCVGERERGPAVASAASCLGQLARITMPAMIAYEPVWAIGAAEPAPPSYVRDVVRAMKAGLPARLRGAPVLYGGAAGPGLLAAVRPEVDGLFLGRFAHDPENVRAVLDDAADVARAETVRR